MRLLVHSNTRSDEFILMLREMAINARSPQQVIDQIDDLASVEGKDGELDKQSAQIDELKTDIEDLQSAIWALCTKLVLDMPEEKYPEEVRNALQGLQRTGRKLNGDLATLLDACEAKAKAIHEAARKQYEATRRKGRCKKT